mmetsp:Transcript_18057/g.41433  ORF Transcript_18057/g.41433 Transcript_18057/m.41433 type:complete len:493 (-) Transcript_18057:344-1822(-)
MPRNVVGNVGIAHDEIVVDGPSLIIFPVKRSWIGVLADDRVAVVGAVVNVEAGPVDALGQDGRFGDWRHPSLGESPQKVPLGKGAALHLEVPKEPPRADSGCLVGHHLCLAKVSQKVVPSDRERPVPLRELPGLGNPLHEVRQQRRRELVKGPGPLPRQPRHAPAGNLFGIAVDETAVRHGGRVVPTDVGNVLPGREGPSLLEKDVVRVAVQIGIVIDVWIEPELAVVEPIGPKGVADKDGRGFSQCRPQHLEGVAVVFANDVHVAIGKGLVENPKSRDHVLQSLLDDAVGNVRQNLEGSLDVVGVLGPAIARGSSQIMSAVVKAVFRPGRSVQIGPHDESEFPAPLCRPDKVLPAPGNVRLSLALDETQAGNPPDPVSHGNPQVRDAVLFERLEIVKCQKGVPVAFHVSGGGFDAPGRGSEDLSERVFVDGIVHPVLGDAGPDFGGRSVALESVDQVVVHGFLGLDRQNGLANLHVAEVVGSSSVSSSGSA